MRIVTIVGSSILVVAGYVAIEPQARNAAGGDVGTAVVLKKRADDGPYGASAYSFRYATQDVAFHRNAVDLVFSNCGLLHITPEVDTKSRVTKTAAKSLADLHSFPSDGWKTKCIEPEAGSVYAMEIDDGTMHIRVKFHVSAVSKSEVRLEWGHFHDPSNAEYGTAGLCGGTHNSE